MNHYVVSYSKKGFEGIFNFMVPAQDSEQAETVVTFLVDARISVISTTNAGKIYE